MVSPVLIHGTFLWSRSKLFACLMASSKHHHASGLGLGGGFTNCAPKLSRAGFSPPWSQVSTAEAFTFKFIKQVSRFLLSAKRTTTCLVTCCRLRYDSRQSRVMSPVNPA